MKDQDITALAREYAEEEIRTELPDITESAREKTISAVAERTEQAYRFLLRRYCLVDKELLKRNTKSQIERVNDSSIDSRSWLYHVGSLNELKYLFPEIAKEVEG